MTIESMLAKDFAALVDRLKADDFARKALAKLERADHWRLAAIGGAGAAGAAIAASQFSALTTAIADAVPGFSNYSATAAGVSLDLGAAPMMMAVLLFAAVGGATAMIVPGAR
jgi:hypothetical protein